jgi:ankyrin repeat protein
VKVNKYVAAVVARQKDKVVQGIEKGRLEASTLIPVSKQSSYWDGTPLPMPNRKPYLMVPFINYVCFRRDLETLVLLLEHSSGKSKKVLGVCDVTSMSPLHIAAAHDFVAGVAALSEFGFPLHGATDRGITPIMCAVSRTDPSVTSLNMAKMMLAEATVAAINGQDQWGQTALHYATDDQWVEAVALLLSHGADANIRDNDGHTPLFDAVGSSTYGKCRFPAPVDTTREQKGKEILNLLLKHNADVNLQDKDGMTVLHIIVTKLDTNMFNNDMFEAILNAGANIHIKDKEGYTPLLHAVNFYNPRFVCALAKLYSPRQLSWRHKLEAGGEGSGIGPHYTTALYLPIERVADMESQVAACFHIVQILIAAGHAIYSEVL